MSSHIRSRARNIRFRREGGDHPLWSPDGKELFFLHDRTLFAVSVTAQPTFSVSNPVRLPVRDSVQQTTGFSVRDYDITPDGKQFITIFSGDQAQSSERHTPPQQIEVVLNWLEELKQRVPVK